MGTYVTPARAHDATYLLQQQLMFNEIDVAGARARTRKVAKHREPRTVLTLIPNTPDEQAAAERVVRKAADHLGLGADALHEVLLALGLVEPAVKHQTRFNGAVGRPTGVCPQCGRAIHLRGDLTLIAHTRISHDPGAARCPGTHMHPKAEDTR